MTNGLEAGDIEVVVRRYLARVGRRYIPLFGALLVLLLLATMMPSRSPVTNIAPIGQQGSETDLGADDLGPRTAPGDVAAPRQRGGGDGPSNSNRTVDLGNDAITPPAKAGSAGVARSGVKCGPGVRQVKFTQYAPLCVPKYTGNNGGATSRGVTKDKITITYRRASSAQDSAINAALGDANLDDDAFISDMRTYMGYFNKVFELYGRQVEMRVFDGQGDYLNEHQGLDQGQARADAQTAVDLGAFLDHTFPLKGSYPYWQALADRKTITLGPTGFPNKWYAERQPYWFSMAPTGTGVGNWLAMLTCRRLAKMNAIFAGDPLFKNTKRVFGLVHPDNPEYREIGRLIMDQTTKCGARPIRQISYTINVAQMGNQATSIAAQLNAADVTTVLCFCDPVFPIFMTNAADGQEYHPEWWSPGWGDGQGQTLNQDQWEHAFIIGARYPKRADDEAYRVFKTIKPKEEPANLYWGVGYAMMLMLFNGLQQAGPNLNPTTFQKGWFSLGKISGRAGTLEFKPGNYSPVVSAPLAWWDTDKVRDHNGEPGSYLPWDTTKFFPFDPARAREWGSGQLHCFGR